MVTILQGPGDKLNAGLLAGMKIAATFASLAAVKQRNALLAREVVIREETSKFTQAALGSQTRARDAETTLANARMANISDRIEADLAAVKTQTKGEQQKTVQATIRSMIDVSDDNLTEEEASITAAAAMEASGVVPNEANLMARTMMVKGEHSQAVAALDVEHRRAAAHALQAQSRAVGAIPPEYSALISTQTNRIRGLDAEILAMDRIGRFLGPQTGINTSTKSLKAERDASAQLILDLGSAFRGGNLGRNAAADPNLPTILNDESGRQAYNRLQSGARFIDPNGNVQTKP